MTDRLVVGLVGEYGRATISDSVVQFGFAMMPRGRLRAAFGLTSGTMSGTSTSIRNAPELSTAIAPRDTAIGAHSAEISSGTSNIAMSTPSKNSGDWRCALRFSSFTRRLAIRAAPSRTPSRSVAVYSRKLPRNVFVPA